MYAGFQGGSLPVPCKCCTSRVNKGNSSLHRVRILVCARRICNLQVAYFELWGAGIACWLQRRTRDRQIASLNPGRSARDNFLLQRQLCVLTLIRCPFRTHPHPPHHHIPPRVTAVARQRPRLFRKKCRRQVTPKHAYTFDPTKSEWADHAAVQA